MTRKIDKTQYQRLRLIQQIAAYLQKVLDDLVEEAEEITGEKGNVFRTFDYVMNDFGTVDELLDSLGVSYDKCN